MSTLRVNNLQIGQSGTAAQNFTLYQPTTPDGTLRLAVGNSGATTGDVLSVSGTGLSVTGTLSATGNVTLSGGTANGILYLNGSKVATTGSALTFNGTTFQYTGAANFATSSGNVGIGTSSPQDILDINSPSGTAAIRIATQGVGSLTWRIASQLVGVANAGFAIRDETNAVNRLVIDGSGNVGIGTSSPSQRLEASFNDATTNRTNPVNVAAITATSTSSTGAVYNGFGPALVFRSQSYNGTVYNGPRVRMVINDNSVQTTQGASLAFDITNTKGGSPVEAMLLDSNGNLGLGVTPSAWSVAKGFEIASPAGITSAGTGLNVGTNTYFNGSNWIYKTSAAATLAVQTNGTHYWSIAASGTAGNAITFTQAMTLDASGNLLVASTNSSMTTGTGIKLTAAGGGASTPTLGLVGNSSDNGQGSYHLYSSSLSQYQFYVSYGGTIYARSTSITGLSDISEKQNIRDLETGLNSVLALQPRRFDWKNGSGANVSGFIAQEVQSVLPDLVESYKISDEENKLGLKMGDMIPTLVKAIQEQQALIAALTARIAALEGTQP